MAHKILSRETIYTGRVVTLTLEEIQIDDRPPRKREVLIHPGAVAIVPLDIDGSILLVRQYRSAAEETLLEIPAGTLEKDESPEVCARREMQEETGYLPGTLQSLGGIYVAPSYTSEYIHLFLATDLSESRLTGDDDEEIEVVRMSIEDAIDAIERNEIRDGKSVAAILRAARILG